MAIMMDSMRRLEVVPHTGSRVATGVYTVIDTFEGHDEIIVDGPNGIETLSYREVEGLVRLGYADYE